MDKVKHATIMRKQGWLSRCPPDFQAEVLQRCHIRKLPAGGAAYNAEDPPGGMVGVVAGSLHVRVPPGDSIITLFPPGAWIGAAAAFRRAGRWVSVRCFAETTILHLPQAEFEVLIQNAEYCRLIAISVAEDLGEAVSVIANLTHPDSEIRVAQRLLTFVGVYGADHRESLDVSQSDLAAMCGISRQTLAKVLTGLEKRGIVQTSYRRIEIIDVAALTSLARDDDRVFR